MITDAEQRIAISNLGWVDGGSVWTYDALANRHSQTQLSDAQYLSLHGGTQEFFAAVNHFEGSRIEITVQTFERPEKGIGRITVADGKATLEGDEADWETVPAHYVGWLKGESGVPSGYVAIRRIGRTADVVPLEWFDSSYDHVYQAPMSVVEIPERGRLVFGVARSSSLIVTQTDTPGREERKVELADRHGNPAPCLRHRTSELWAGDYDTVVRLDYRTWTVTAASRLQGAPEGVWMFVGDLWMPPIGDYVLVARPFSGDVVVLDPADLRVQREIPLGRQPLTAAILRDGRVVARDWKTGDLLLGT